MGIGVYSSGDVAGSAAAAIHESGPGQIRPDGAAAKWNVYVSVDDVDARRRACDGEWRGACWLVQETSIAPAGWR